MTTFAITGPIGYRRHTIDKTCQSNQGHKHKFDHASIIIEGRVEVTFYDIDDREIAKREFAKGGVVEVPANCKHLFKALTDDVEYFCVFSHRDLGGLILQHYAGNDKAYE